MKPDQPIDVRPGKGYWRARLAVLLLVIGVFVGVWSEPNLIRASFFIGASIALSASAIFARLSSREDRHVSP